MSSAAWCLRRAYLLAAVALEPACLHGTAKPTKGAVMQQLAHPPQTCAAPLAEPHATLPPPACRARVAVSDALGLAEAARERHGDDDEE